MVYDWTQLGIKEITNLYLYGTPTTPSDLTNDSLIRPKDIQGGPRYGVDVEVNSASFMTTGPGRFALGSQSSMVETFFSTVVSNSWFVKGQSYTKVELRDILIANGLANKIRRNLWYTTVPCPAFASRGLAPVLPPSLVLAGAREPMPSAPSHFPHHSLSTPRL